MAKVFSFLKTSINGKIKFLETTTEEQTIAQLYLYLSSSAKGKKKEIIHSYSSLEEESSETEFTKTKFEEGQSSRVIHGRRRPSYIPNPYIQRSHTGPKNKLRLSRKIIANPDLRDEIINIDESPENDLGKKKDQNKNQVQKRKPNKRLTKAEAIRIFASILNL